MDKQTHVSDASFGGSRACQACLQISSAWLGLPPGKLLYAELCDVLFTPSSEEVPPGRQSATETVLTRLLLSSSTLPGCADCFKAASADEFCCTESLLCDSCSPSSSGCTLSTVRAPRNARICRKASGNAEAAPKPTGLFPLQQTARQQPSSISGQSLSSEDSSRQAADASHLRPPET